MAEKQVGIFRVATAAVIVNDDSKVLLTQRGLDRDHHAGEWEILSGRLDQGEGFEEALAREAMEELGIQIEILSILDTFHFFRGEEKLEHVGVAYLTKYTEGEIRLDGIEEVDYAWLSFQEAKDMVKDQGILQNLELAEKTIGL